MIAAARACACCFALSLFGLMRMESKILDESIGMTDFDYATRKPSSLDIAKAFNFAPGIDEKRLQVLKASHDHEGNYHKQVARSFHAGKPRGPGRIAFAQ